MSVALEPAEHLRREASRSGLTEVEVRWKRDVACVGDEQGGNGGRQAIEQRRHGLERDHRVVFCLDEEGGRVDAPERVARAVSYVVVAGVVETETRRDDDVVELPDAPEPMGRRQRYGPRPSARDERPIHRQ